MKKNYILFLFIMLVTYTAKSQTVLFDQPINGTNGIVTDNFSDGTTSVYSADDFNLTVSSNIDIITAYGFQNQGDFDTFTTGVDVFIYADAAGVPNSDPTSLGTGLLELINLDPAGPAVNIIPDGAGGYDIEIDVAQAYGSTFTLGAGTYWLVIAPYVLSTGADRWNWYQATDGTLSPAVLIDPGDVFGAGVTSWTSLAGLVGWSALAFKIEEAALSVDEFSLASVSVYPNPAKNVINIDLPNSYTNFETEIFSVTGQLVLKSNDKAQLDISELNSGMYMLRISTEHGSVTKQIVKE